MKATDVIVKAAAAVNNKIEKMSSALLPLVMVVLALIIGCFGIDCVKQIPFHEGPDYIFDAVIGIGEGLILWVFAIVLAFRDLYKNY